MMEIGSKLSWSLLRDASDVGKSSMRRASNSTFRGHLERFLDGLGIRISASSSPTMAITA